jgi:predicted benzoate:H+ symporter BenE
MSRLSIFVAAVVLSVAVTSMSQMASAKEHPKLRQPHFISEQFRRANDAVVAVPEMPSTMYTGGWSAPAGR